ncbi:MAG: hypothetical protein ACRCZO_13565 [Cetobacterium sp.]
MKKFLLIAVLAVSSVSFAKGHGNNGGRNGMMNGNGSMNCSMMDGNGNNGRNGMMGATISPELRREIQNNNIAIGEKNLEIKKIMNTDTPDIKKIEKLNSEIFAIKATNKTKMQENYIKTRVVK